MKSAISEQWWFGLLVMVLLGLAVASIPRCSGAECTLVWNEPPAAEQVVKWRVYRGIELLAEVTTPSATITLPDQPCEVSVVAVNAVGTSPPATIRLVCIADQTSTDLRAWHTFRTYHREALPGPRFYRTRIETPP